ncbi:Hpt domain-containing protein [Aeoliella mucimassa]|uniref:Hpt domain protein n=1 Tax=Aeoliella mucimassa TaxID=2527972 RepID=A0A518AT92_9BACT|nr:Hpt domain-containing protein [Aeoliella mucimassa]QDU57942.1 Hpt domain protein [Aeoliella mucimassa]
MLIDQLSQRSDILNLDDLKNRCLGNVAFVEQVLELLAERGEADIALLEESLNKSDYEKLYHVAHRLKGAFANASAKRMSSTAEELCDASRSQEERCLREKVESLRNQWNEFTNLIDRNSGDSQHGAFAVEGAEMTNRNAVSV